MIFAPLMLAAAMLVPVHGVVLGDGPNGTEIVRLNAATDQIPAQTRAYRLPRRFASGTGIDAFADLSTRPLSLRDVEPAGDFTPGAPDRARTEPVDAGTTLPAATLVDQDGNAVDLAHAFDGRTALISFVFTRCPDKDICPAITGKYAYMQARLDPTKFALVQISLDPVYDSPAVLKRYGQQFGAKSGNWYLLTGKGITIQRVLDAFGIDSLRVSTANFIHGDKLFVVAPTGRVAYIVDTAGWDPEGVMSEARNVAGMASNPWERFKLSLIANVVAMCGGSQFAGVVLLELGLFFIILAVVASGLWVVARVLWRNG